MGCAFALGLIMGSVALMGAVTAGFPSWVIQQVVMMLVALNLLPVARKVPLLNSIVHDVDKLMVFYEANPKYTSASHTLLRLVPMINWFVFWREIRVMLV